MKIWDIDSHMLGNIIISIHFTVLFTIEVRWLVRWRSPWHMTTTLACVVLVRMFLIEVV